MADSGFSSMFEAAQRAFETIDPMRSNFGPALEQYWRRQDRMLDSLEDFTIGWFERRHEAARSAADCARRMVEVGSPAEAMREWQAWMLGSLGRLTTDGLALEKHLMSLVEVATPPVTGPPAGEPERKTPATAGRARAA